MLLYPKSKQHDYKRGIAEIKNEVGERIGTGFVLKDNYVGTCAHIFDNYSEDYIYTLTFWLSDNSFIETKGVVKFKSDIESVRDIGIIRIIDDVELGLKYFNFPQMYNEFEPKELKSFGYSTYTASIREGWGQGIYLGPVRVEDKSINISILQARFPESQSGFSGAPVWDIESGLVIGIISENYIPQEEFRNRDTTWIMPIKLIEDALNRIESFSNTPAILLEARIELIENFLKEEEKNNKNE